MLLCGLRRECWVDPFYVAVAGILVFAIAERFGLTVPAAWRTCRRLLAGRDRPAVPYWKRRRFS